ncbi:MAG TPA: ROK family transcriptional regulator [Nocardioides sp.]|uniref:ROK family transcriptional regulator n=1 Tax=Nocardioides sp. TaxID=35761 RepID=UPI002E360CCC|nr:ROK family transcriptional regulator [Nocardioides sp.]HEX3931418.1 ROK family transcriptional regulator [Nocardioides sp.]
MPGHSLAQLRGSNLRAITALLGSAGPQSRADLARGSGLSRTTVSSLVSELLDNGLVVETEDRGTPYKGGSGRPPLLVALALRPGGVAGVDIGHRHIRVAVSDRSARILAEVETQTDADPHGNATLDIAADLVERARTEAGLPLSELLMVGLCVPAPIDRRSARVDQSVLPGWHELAPAEELSRRVGLPVVVDNDANLGAIAEHQHGAGRGTADLLYVKLASGVGAGLVLGGRLHRGSTGLAGEIGHVLAREDGDLCRCGSRGCLETEVSTRHLLALLRPKLGAALDLLGLLALDADGDPTVRSVLTGAGHTAGRVLAGVCTTLNPARIVVGGSLGASPSLVAAIRVGVDRYAHPEAAASCEVVSGRFGGRAELMGSLALAISRAGELA